MAIEIRGVPADRALRARIMAQLTAALAHLTTKPTTAQATLFDENGPKGGPAMRCAISVTVPYRPLIRVERVATTSGLAFDGAFAAIERQLERYRERDRDIKRRPKKYFVARRLLTGGLAEPGRPARARRRKAG